MAPPKGTLWPLERHTAAKHQILRHYLDAWIPIMASFRSELVLIDGFAGPGRYTKGEAGSPIHMLEAFLAHAQRHAIEARSRLTWIFIEQQPDRADYLEDQIARIRPLLPTGWNAAVRPGDFAVKMAAVAEWLAAKQPTPPTFLFIDPFGYAQTRLDLSARILGYPHCEVLIFVPIEHIARFINEPNVQRALANLMSGDSWLPALGEPTIVGKVAAIREAYLGRLRQDARWVRSFAIKSDDAEYALFFASGHERGIEKMKEAMWAVDPVGGTTYTDATAPGQSVLFSDAIDFGAIERALRSAFGADWFRYEEAEDVIRETPYLPRHLRQELDRLRSKALVNLLPGSKPFDDRALWCFPP